MTENNTDEIDLAFVGKQIKKLYHSFLVWCYRGVQFVIKHWIALAAICLTGIVVGHFWQNSVEPNNSSTLIIQTNFKSTNYVYESLSLLRDKSIQGDSAFLVKNNFKYEDREILGIAIEPVVNILEILENPRSYNRNLNEFLAQTDFVDDLLLSEVFFNEYKYHRLVIYTTPYGNESTLKKVIEYLNNNKLYNDTKVIAIKDTKAKIAANKKTIDLIDGILENSAKAIKGSEPESGQITFNAQNYTNLADLVDGKTDLLEENEDLNRELLKYNNVVQLVNTPSTVPITSLKHKKRLLLPIVLIFLYCFFFFIKEMFTKARRLAVES